MSLGDYSKETVLFDGPVKVSPMSRIRGRKGRVIAEDELYIPPEAEDKMVTEVWIDGELMDVIDQDDSCKPYEPNDRCGGCGECLLMQIAHRGGDNPFGEQGDPELVPSTKFVQVPLASHPHLAARWRPPPAPQGPKLRDGGSLDQIRDLLRKGKT